MAFKSGDWKRAFWTELSLLDEEGQEVTSSRTCNSGEYLLYLPNTERTPIDSRGSAPADTFFDGIKPAP